MRAVIDIESNGLIKKSRDKETGLINPAADKIYCLSYEDLNTGLIRTITDSNEIKAFLLNPNLTFIGHNIIRYDIPLLEKLLNIKISCKIIDTLGLSWYLFPKRKKHGLEYWGDELGIAKPQILDWNNQSIEVYSHRCEEDVKINSKLYSLFIEKLYAIYEDEDEINRIINYLNFKLDCAREQEENPIKLDVELINKSLIELKSLQEEKINNLAKAMPPEISYNTAQKPDSLYKKDGELSVRGEKWLNLLISNNLPLDWDKEVKYEVSRKEGNPKSYIQLKNWLFSLGWSPITFKYERDKKTNQNKKIEQIYNKITEGVCDSIKKLYDAEPALENLDSLSKINHRITVFEGFLRDKDEDDLITADVMGFTKTLRFIHTKLVNLPSISKPFAANIRRSLIATDDDHILCGSDMSQLEDNTKKHYIYPHDPEYVKTISTPGYDAHLAIGVSSEMISPEDAEFYKWYDKIKTENPKHEFTVEEVSRFKRIVPVRKDAKQVNFSCTYNAGPPKIALTSGMKLDVAILLHKTFWKLNWSIKQIAANCKIKRINGEMWLYNPISRFYYFLEYEQDSFSSLNQSSGVYCFDTYIREVRSRGIKISGQWHDEILSNILKKDKEQVGKYLDESIDRVNEILKLNVTLGISKDFSHDYGGAH